MSTHSAPENQNNNWSNRQKQFSSRKVHEILSNPMTANYINRWEILSYEDDMLMIFWNAADKKRMCIVNNEHEIKILGSRKKEIEDAILEDIELWLWDNIYQIKLNTESALALFLEWVIDINHIKNAKIIDGNIIFDWVEFNFADKSNSMF